MTLPSPETMLTYASILEKPQYWVDPRGRKWLLATGEIIEAACAALRHCASAPAQQKLEPEYVMVGWFNPWNDYHGFQQVHRDAEGTDGTFPLFCRASELAKAELPPQAFPSTECGGDNG